MSRVAKIVALNFLIWGFIFLCVVFVWCLTQVGSDAGGSHGLSSLVIGVGLLAAVLLAVIAIVPFWIILKRAGSHPALSILMLVPLVNLVTLYLIAFSKSKSVPSHTCGD